MEVGGYRGKRTCLAHSYVPKAHFIGRSPASFFMRRRRASFKKRAFCLQDKRLFFCGAGGGGRTRMVSLPPDFESGASANSTTPAKLRFILYNTFYKKSRIIFTYLNEKFIDFLCILR